MADNTTNQDRVFMGWVGFIEVPGGYRGDYTYRRMNYITTEDSCYVSKADNNKGNPLTDTTKWVCIANGKPATTAAQTCLERINELNRLLTQLAAAITKVEDASGVTADARAALADLQSKLAGMTETKETLEALVADVYNATAAANRAYAIATQIEGVNVMATKPATMTLDYVASAPVGVDVQINVTLQPSTANQSVVFVPLGGADVTPAGLVKSPAEAGDVKLYVVSTEQSGVWRQVTISYRAPSPLTQDDGTVLTQDDGTTTLDV